uniref:RRM domain-containing protein n=1 Tax=Heterorhabditis bacteriophora TaxID=37862 RepID=A0A1I7XAR7_HETBA
MHIDSPVPITPRKQPLRFAKGETNIISLVVKDDVIELSSGDEEHHPKTDESLKDHSSPDGDSFDLCEQFLIFVLLPYPYQDNVILLQDLKKLRNESSQAETDDDDNDSSQCGNDVFIVNDRSLDTEDDSESEDSEQSFSDEEFKNKKRQILDSLKDSFNSPSVLVKPKMKLVDSDEHFLMSLSVDFEGTRHPEAVKYIKKGVKGRKIREELSDRLFQIFRTQCFRDELPECLTVTWNPRLLKTAGMCRNKSDRTSSIELSVKVCTSAGKAQYIYNSCSQYCGSICLIHNLLCYCRLCVSYLPNIRRILFSLFQILVNWILVFESEISSLVGESTKMDEPPTKKKRTVLANESKEGEASPTMTLNGTAVITAPPVLSAPAMIRTISASPTASFAAQLSNPSLTMGLPMVPPPVPPPIFIPNQHIRPTLPSMPITNIFVPHQVWEDPSLAEWDRNDFRIFCGDLGNEVVRDSRSNKSKGYGFVSFAESEIEEYMIRDACEAVENKRMEDSDSAVVMQELIEFLTPSTRLDVRRTALDYVVGLSGAFDGSAGKLFIDNNFALGQALCNLCEATTSDRSQTLSALTNFTSGSAEAADFVLMKSRILQLAYDSCKMRASYATFAARLLANLSRHFPDRVQDKLQEHDAESLMLIMGSLKV